MSKGFVTFITLELLVSSVCQRVPFQIALVLESSTTKVALIGPLIPVGGQVFAMAAGPLRYLTTHFASELGSAFYE